MTASPNIVLICVDQWRGDCLSIAGHPVVHTPYLDQLASKGCRFTQAYSAVPTCIAARACLFTGLSQRSHGRVGYQDGVPWEYPVTLAGEFTRHGYQTQAVGKMHVYPERWLAGFQHVVLHDGYLHFARKGHHLDRIDDYIPWLRERSDAAADYFDHGVNCNSVVARPWDKPEALHPTNFVVTQGIDFLRRRDPTKPFFLYLSFHRPHPPYDPPAWAFEQYASRDMPEPPVGDWAAMWDDYGDSNRPDTFVGTMRPDVLQRARAGYYGHMTHIDHQINRFMEVLQEYGEADNTYVCFVADHGEMLGDHHLFRKGFPYEGSAHVPLILRGPKESGIRRDSTCEQVTELRDILPTLLECAGLPIPENVEGKSLLGSAQGESIEWREYLHGEHVLLGQSLHWIANGHEKYIWCSGTGAEQLFNLDDDPQEVHDLASKAEHGDRLRYWRARLIDELTGREEGFTDGKGLMPGRPVKPLLNATTSVQP